MYIKVPDSSAALFLYAIYCKNILKWKPAILPTLTSIRLHDLSCFSYTEVISPTYIIWASETLSRRAQLEGHLP